MTVFERTFKRLGALIDGSAWMLILPALLALFFIDAPMAKTLGQWSLYFLVLAGVVVIISRITFPMLDLPKHVRAAAGGDVANAIVVFAVIMFVAQLILSFVLWARPMG